MPRGASKVKMSLSNISPNQSYINSIINKPVSNTSAPINTLKKPTTLKTPMISRIHGQNAGCGSCGRK
jgi:hypothetical protein